MLVCLAVWVGVWGYLWSLDAKVRRLREDLSHGINDGLEEEDGP
jgi:CcmD family protein